MFPVRSKSVNDGLETHSIMTAMLQSNALRFLSVCSGAGGLDIGLEAAGWSSLAQIEIDADCCGTLTTSAAHKRSASRVIHAALEDVDARGLRESLGLRRGQLELLAGGPPCQPFTTHGLRQTLRDARASSVFPSYLKLVEEFEPQSLVIENVDGFLSAALHHVTLAERETRALARHEMKGSFLRWVLGELDRLGYAVSWGVMEAADYGVPQFRQRAILIGVRGHEPCYLPRATHERPLTLREGLRRVKEPGPIQPLSARKAAIYDLIPAGGNWRSLPVEVQRETMGRAFFATGGKSGWWRRLAWDEPAPTILGMPDHSSTGLIHPDQTRCLGLNECAALQSFPEWVKFSGSPRSGYQQVGNAVPPLLGEALGVEIKRHLEGVRQLAPPSPPWRSESANRRIGTHGWLTRRGNSTAVYINAKVRPDHVWALEDERFRIELGTREAGEHREDTPRLRHSA